MARPQRPWETGGPPAAAFSRMVEEQKGARARQARQALGLPEPEQPQVETGALRQSHFPRVTLNLGDVVIDPAVVERMRDEMLSMSVFGNMFSRRESPEQRRIREEQRKAANERALGLLREAGEEGAQLADGEAVLIPSRQFEELTYGIISEGGGMVVVFHRTLGRMGSICIQAMHEAPPADVLLTRLMLCKNDERQLWQVGNFNGGDTWHFLPKQVREWTKTRRHSDQFGGFIFDRLPFPRF